jgi:signal peptidase I
MDAEETAESRIEGAPTPSEAGSPPTPPRRWLVAVGVAVLVLAGVLSVLALPFLLLALFPFALGVFLGIRGWVGIGIAMSAMAVVVPIAVHILLVSLAVGVYEVPSEAMQPTLQVGDRILVDKTGIDAVNVGGIVVFHPPVGADNGTECGAPHSPQQACPKPTEGESSQSFVKRIVAGPGDTLSIREGHPVVNGIEKTDEPYITPCGAAAACDMPRTIRIPPDHYFMLGDNRGASDDSRFWGPVPESWIVGVVFARSLPLGRASIF